MKKILFQGDSITDCSRSRENLEDMGKGYPLLVKAYLGVEYSEEFEIVNRGVSGNRIVDLYARIKADIINLAPDYMSILIGVNDAWHELGGNNGVDAEKYEKIYCMLIEEIKEALPNIKIMILEPFCLRGIATENTAEDPDRWDIISAEVKKRAEKARAVADKYNLVFVPLQEMFDKASEKGKEVNWSVDGVHPTPAGHELIKREWLKNFSFLRHQI